MMIIFRAEKDNPRKFKIIIKDNNKFVFEKESFEFNYSEFGRTYINEKYAFADEFAEGNKLLLPSVFLEGPNGIDSRCFFDFEELSMKLFIEENSEGIVAHRLEDSSIILNSNYVASNNTIIDNKIFSNEDANLVFFGANEKCIKIALDLNMSYNCTENHIFNLLRQMNYFELKKQSGKFVTFKTEEKDPTLDAVTNLIMKQTLAYLITKINNTIDYIAGSGVSFFFNNGFHSNGTVFSLPDYYQEKIDSVIESEAFKMKVSI